MPVKRNGTERTTGHSNVASLLPEPNVILHERETQELTYVRMWTLAAFFLICQLFYLFFFGFIQVFSILQERIGTDCLGGGLTCMSAAIGRA